ncbi:MULTISPECIES: hypothetical protein [unclassified Microcoleus]
MPYSQFTTIAKAKQAFGLTVQEGSRFIPPLSPDRTLRYPQRHSQR